MFDQNKRVIFPTEDGGVSIIIPAPGVSDQEVIRAVPTGKPYKIVDASEIPADRTFRDAWEYIE